MVLCCLGASARHTPVEVVSRGSEKGAWHDASGYGKPMSGILRGKNVASITYSLNVGKKVKRGCRSILKELSRSAGMETRAGSVTDCTAPSRRNGVMVFIGGETMSGTARTSEEPMHRRIVPQLTAAGTFCFRTNPLRASFSVFHLLCLLSPYAANCQGLCPGRFKLE